ncbi:putative metallo-hydrolase YflN [Peptococcaceae bacterium CEB3]|nr:putative metallo-hydrolase YflN [Peptococcaceae bacterium CEB3]
MLITDEVHLVDGVKGAHVYLVASQEPFLVDTGMPGQERRIIEYIRSVGLNPRHLTGIILTHFDVDHVGSVRNLASALECPVYAHETEVPYIRGQKPRPGMKRFLPHLVSPVYGLLRPPEELRPCADMFHDWEVLPTPGHTPGHIVLYRNGIAIVGDLLQGGRIRPAPPYLTWNSGELKESIRQLISRPLRWILPGHGPATPASNHWLDRLERSL